MKNSPPPDQSGSARGFFERTVAEYMVRDVVCVRPATTLREVNELFVVHDFNSFPVIEQAKLVGIFSKFDFMRAFAFTNDHMLPHYSALMETPVAALMRERLMTVRPDMPLTRVLEQMVGHRTRSFPVLKEDQLAGIISRGDIMSALAESTSETTEFFCRTAQSQLSE